MDLQTLRNSDVYLLPGRLNSIDYILSLLDTDINTMIERNRKREVVDKRQLAMYLIYKTTEMPLMKIGETFKRGHATVIHACKSIEDRFFWDKKFKEYVDYLIIRLRENEVFN